MAKQQQPHRTAGSARGGRALHGVHGRAACSNAAGRFEAHETSAFDDGWEIEPGEAQQVRTDIIVEKPRSLITYNSSPDIHLDRSINPYKGCEHGCIYCYARPNHAYRGLSPGLDFETKLFAKVGAASTLQRELSRKSYRPAPIMFAGDTDIYQPVERKLGIARSILEVLHECRHPFSIVTKSALILRDKDLIVPMAQEQLADVAISLTTLDPSLARAMEPRAAAPRLRLRAIERLAGMGVQVRVLTAPLIPALNEPELERILESAASAGATHAGYVLLRLPLEIGDLFREWLEQHYPDRAKRIMSLVRSTHAGQDYRAEWGVRQKGTGPYAELIAARFAAAVRRFGLLLERSPLRTDLFRPPRTEGGGTQLSLFGTVWNEAEPGACVNKSGDALT